ncbi:pectin lyase fold/virulence factor, Pectate lyase superfamily protein [Artemisia annua]|uniref:Pectin lyase fold/virulence factor, Pectate lyase superfamily protein n=1 Tax=Artemisia annua TaxID=35608 RepID=A0A2U1NST2_ARTAN|nr:pectin lyase fold/virulence factor, Pectate lyase superfamily protein [Artemisia annua]
MGVFLGYTMMVVLWLASFIMVNHLCVVYSSPDKWLVRGYAHDHHSLIRKLQEYKSYFFQRQRVSLASSLSPSPSPSSPARSSSGMILVTTYGADPTGKTDSTDAILEAISDAVSIDTDEYLMQGISNVGGVQINLEGGIYKISRHIKLPEAGLGNIVIFGGTLKASDNFSTDSYMIDLSSSSNRDYSYEFVTLRDLMLDCNFRGGGIRASKTLRTSIDNCYIAHFGTTGILVQGGHETYIRNSFLGQNITAGADPGERNFTGTGIDLQGNDNAVTDVVIFSAAVGIMISGQANMITGVHCYNKAYGFGGTGIYLKVPGITQTRIVNSYFDFTGIVAEDPVQLHVSDCFFLGDAFIVLKSLRGVVDGINIVNNMFSGSNKGIDIVQLDQTSKEFNEIGDQVVIDQNSANGMNMKATAAKVVTQVNGTSWTIDFNKILLFPRRIKFAQHTLMTNTSNSFPNTILRNISNNQVMIESDTMVIGSALVSVDQGFTMLG